MAKADPAAQWLERVEAVARGEESKEALAELRAALRAPHARAVVKAARVAAERGWNALGPDVAKAFARLLDSPAKADPGCLAKVALIETMGSLEYDDEALFLRGARHSQMEPVWGKPIDTAGNLRGTCAGALLRTGYLDIRYELVTLLADPEVEARTAAARAFALLPGESSELVLRVKADAGDESPDVVAACFSGLMSLAPERSLAFVAKFLDSPTPTTAEDAAIALGESKLPEACALLVARWKGAFDAEVRKALALPIALTRAEQGFAFLLETLDKERFDTAVAVLEALAIYREDPAKRAQIESAVEERGEVRMEAEFQRYFTVEAE
jgi:HEAT repeat protein